MHAHSHSLAPALCSPTHYLASLSNPTYRASPHDAHIAAPFAPQRVSPTYTHTRTRTQMDAFVDSSTSSTRPHDATTQTAIQPTAPRTHTHALPLLGLEEFALSARLRPLIG